MTPLTPETPAPSSPLPQRAPQIRLDYLDGLRGIAAMYVVLYHIYRVLEFHQQWQKMPLVLQQMFAWTRYGHLSVGIFIVLSGYCLTLPVVRSSAKNVNGGFLGFAFRRARRLLPPYYAALGLSLLLLGIGYVVQAKNHQWDAHLVSNFTPLSLLSHVFLIHNLSPTTAYTVNPAFWSVATEAQIYVFFPLILLPLWRQRGLLITVGTAFLIGLAPHRLFHGALDQACPWYLGLFALGMVGAIISMSDQPRLANLRAVAPWFQFAGLSGIIAVIMCWKVQNLDPLLWLFDTIVGCGTLSLLVFCTAQITHPVPQSRSLVLQILGSRLAIFLGSFSYSIYLIHYSLLDIAHFLMNKLRLASVLELGVFLCVVVPLVVCLAYVFHRIFERPFMTHSSASSHKKPI